MGFEDNFLAGLDRKKESKDFLHPNIEKAHRRTEEIFKKEAIQLDEFIDPYPEDQVSADKSKAADLKKKFETNEPHKKYADVMEGVIYRQIGRSGWFGEKAQAIKTSLYDDYINGIDLMVEFEEESRAFRHLGLAIDVTFSADRNSGTLDKKFDRIKKEMDEGHLAQVKYFKSKNSRMKGVFENLPRVVVGMERTKVMELAAIWLNEDRHAEFLKHPAQRMILEQVLVQLIAFSRYAKECGHDHIAKILSDEIPLIKGILEEKNDIHMGDMKFDQVHRDIISRANGF
ncbi:MAG: hypothetical protein A2808_03710 [Candidatus Moranbacteria bacterium RIFCSPHIGHO2_01_FULL_55_24]|nr:MAG: hypothetical protein A2808_03710 [Candidatus Moranbacteria bacterium RIFCSPHIGHO2_01_FULL_55_24]